MLVVGLGLLAAAVVAAVVALVQRRRLHQLVGAETLTAAQLRDQAEAAAQLSGGGSQRPCTVTGTSQPGPDGPLTASMSNVKCVWHRQVVRRRYVRTRTNGKGTRRQERRTEVVSDVSSHLPFTLVDDTGAVLVVPERATVDRPERSHKEYRADASGASLSVLGVTLRLGSGDGTIGFETEEWVLRPGTQLFVLGEAGEGPGAVRIGKPASGRFLISTRSKAELTANTRRTQRISMVVAVVALVAGLAAVVGGAL